MRLVGCIGLTLALALGSGAAANAATVKIGVVVPFSGANADLGHQMDKAFDLYAKLHANDIAPNKVELVKRDEGPPTGAAGQDRRHRAHHQRQGATAHRLLVLAVGHRAGAGRDAGEGADADR